MNQSVKSMELVSSGGANRPTVSGRASGDTHTEQTAKFGARWQPGSAVAADVKSSPEAYNCIERAPEASCGEREWAEVTEGMHL